MSLINIGDMKIPESSHVRAIRLIENFLATSRKAREARAVRMEEASLNQEMPIEVSFKAAIKNIKT